METLTHNFKIGSVVVAIQVPVIATKPDPHRQNPSIRTKDALIVTKYSDEHLYFHGYPGGFLAKGFREAT